ncbi:uncharacterized protein LOC132275397 [Cornus florida]|uniref:uncharacterized protein LOC132275397 n=1 Tax=Cornus florida TaxID=4283 RepID=UPI0028997AC1|nr:uncharacterized protein LOC132275397 [Cornus florida]
MPAWVSNLKNLRWVILLMGVLNFFVIVLCVILIIVVYPVCGHAHTIPFQLILLASCVRIVATIRTGIAQQATATMILKSPVESEIVDTVIRHERRKRYMRWLWWTRFVTVISVLQFVGAAYLIFIVVKHVCQHGTSRNCVSGHVFNGAKWQRHILVLFLVMVCYVTLGQCFTGTDVLRWRSFYATKDNAWKAHYQEVFDHGIREALCCLGRVKYLSVFAEDEVYSVARLLGDLVAYRAAGTGHLEFLAGLALLQGLSESPKSYEDSEEAPEERIYGAATFHQFAEAAYTGMLLDFGRNPVWFPFVWLYRQGILTPWNRNRRPLLEGDNWWRGHAAAFLKYVNVSPDSLRRGRVSQASCEAAYFIVVLHHLKSVVIAVRGTETPEDLITDGSCRECPLSAEDLDGLINGDHNHPVIRQSVVSTSQHYGHSGVIEAARDLFMQIEGSNGSSSHCSGFLSSLLGTGCECHGYGVRLVGHSLGGAIAALLGIKLYRRYPNLHVYAYGPLPCVDPVIADACSEFVTSIVYSNEFSARLSVASILRLRGAAIMSMSQDNTTEWSIISKVARRFMSVSKYEGSKHEKRVSTSDSNCRASTNENINHCCINGTRCRNGSRVEDQESSLRQNMDFQHCSGDEFDCNNSSNSFASPVCNSSAKVNSFDDPISEFMEAVSSFKDQSAGDLPEMFLPGLVIHIVPQETSSCLSLFRSWGTQEKMCSYGAYIADRKAFKDIIVSPSMFLDHLPWRCHNAMKKILEMRNVRALLGASQMV